MALIMKATLSMSCSHRDGGAVSFFGVFTSPPFSSRFSMTATNSLGVRVMVTIIEPAALSSNGS
ncbi:hypothetical protein [Polyangium mundeleinium]|uniref:Uncharacterized protein n=1 Tax=Polyangium mundeleinium TaxID=2995306 RepID=A0ABT5F8N6_9BACT|nr:hypothetical protein [Polyangium mundeleinium]MDC0749969.1 hypothetical protein [Polyangium mundeleinium]